MTGEDRERATVGRCPAWESVGGRGRRKLTEVGGEALSLMAV